MFHEKQLGSVSERDRVYNLFGRSFFSGRSYSFDSFFERINKLLGLDLDNSQPVEINMVQFPS